MSHNAKPPARAKLADVGRLAGVSAMTVSRVVNNDLRVSELTRERVQSAIRALRYVPNPLARQLKGEPLIRLGVLYDKPCAGYLSEFLVDLLNAASKKQVQLVVEQLAPGDGITLDPTGFLNSGLDAVVIAPPLCDAPDILDKVAASGLVAIQVANAAVDPRLHAVGIDDHDAAVRMTRHLIALGHRRIGFIPGTPTQSAAISRLNGFRQAMREASLPVAKSLVAAGAFTYSSGLTAAERLLALKARPTAIFASNDDMAAATISVAHRVGLQVPADLTVVGFDDTPIATTIWPALTTVRQPIGQMARQAVELLVQQVRARRLGRGAQPTVLRLDVELIQRASDTAPRRTPLNPDRATP